MNPRTHVICYSAEFKVQVEYSGDGEYSLTSGGLTGVQASGIIEQEQGVGIRAQSLKLVGVVQDSRVSANVAVVGDMVHIFTKVSSHLNSSSSPTPYDPDVADMV